MNKIIKAALLSALVFPGAGQFLLKKYILGSILAGIAVAALGVILLNIVERSRLIMAEQIQQGEIPLELETFSALLLNQQAITASSSTVSIASIVLLLVWIISIIDSFVSKT